MPKQRKVQPTIIERIADYERSYPKIAEALTRYTVAMQSYQTALSSFTTPNISISNSTVYTGSF